jgi:ribosome biogenesis GTPase A
MEVNIQCKKILEGINRLDSYLQENIAKEALDLDSNFETTRHQELLVRLKKSLLQYSERDKQLTYIGIMGHFSTGKSSTINSLLAIGEDSEEARKVGLNPVDKTITLITHSENKDSI